MSSFLGADFLHRDGAKTPILAGSVPLVPQCSAMFRQKVTRENLMESWRWETIQAFRENVPPKSHVQPKSSPISVTQKNLIFLSAPIRVKFCSRVYI